MFNSSINEPLKPQAHANYISSSNVAQCRDIGRVEWSEKCLFVNETQACRDFMNYFDYMDFLYCKIPSELFYIALVGMLLWTMLLMFYSIVVVKDIHYKNVLYISYKMGLTEHFAGLTVVAFGNIFRCVIRAVTNYDEESVIIFGEYIGGSLFSITFFAGVIIIVQPFQTIAEYFSIKCIALISSMVVISTTLSNEKMTTFEMFLYFLVFLAFVFTMRMKYMKMQQLATAPMTLERMSDMTSEMLKETYLIKRAQDYTKRITVEENLEDYSMVPSIDVAIQMVINALKPFTKAQFKQSSILKKIYMVFEAPILVMIRILLPTGDLSKPQNGWNKGLAIINLAFVPGILSISMCLGNSTMSGCAVPLTVGYSTYVVVVLLIVFKTKILVKPKKHAIFPVVGFFGALFLQDIIISEMLAAISTLGIFMNLKHTTLSYTLFAIVYTFPELVNRIYFQFNGYHVLSLAATFSGSLYNSIFGLGLFYAVSMLQENNSTIYARMGIGGQTLIVFTSCALVFTLLYMLFTRFQARKSLGWSLITIYAVFILYTLLCEFEIAHHFGTDHFENEDPDFYDISAHHQ